MPAHFTYQAPVRTRLCQGDILQRTDALVAHLQQFHPYYGNHSDYKYFLVLTQSCDLVCRGDKPPDAPYITLAAVRPVEEVLRREAAKSQKPWQRQANVIGAKLKDKLMMFLQGLLDNNREGFFYLHSDVGLGIHQNCCAFLQLSVALKIEHFDMCLTAKIAELTEPFQAKLGYLIGHMYNRVGTTEWNDHYPDNKVSSQASSMLEKTFVAYDDKQIEEGVADLRHDGTLDTKTPEEIRLYIHGKKVLTRKQKFQQEAVRVLCGQNPIDLIRGRISSPLKSDPMLLAGIVQILTDAGLSPDVCNETRDKLVIIFMQQLREYLSDEKMPDKQEVIEKVIAKLLQDALIQLIMHS